MRNIGERYLFVVNTNKYAGNFEREMCAYMTGIIGDCEVGEEEACTFVREEHENIKNWFVEDVSQVADEHGCYRPVALWENGNSFVIYFDCKIDGILIEVMKKRAQEYARQNGIHINKFVILKETTTVEYNEIEI